jgi:chorismate synthase
MRNYQLVNAIHEQKYTALAPAMLILPARVALGALVRQLLVQFDIDIVSHVVQIGAVKCSSSLKRGDMKSIQGTSEKSQVRCLDSNTSKRMIAAIDRAAKNGDTLGGIVEIIFRGLPVGLGSMSQWDQRLDSRLAAALMSIPSVKGVEFGQGFQTASKLGSQVQDQIFYNRKGTLNRKGFFRKTNHAGGIEGGITNGEDVIIRIASKPLSTLQHPLDSVNVKTKQPAKAVVERSDTCIVPALAVVAEAMGSLILADTFLSKFGGDSLSEIKRNYMSWLKTPY